MARVVWIEIRKALDAGGDDCHGEQSDDGSDGGSSKLEAREKPRTKLELSTFFSRATKKGAPRKARKRKASQRHRQACCPS